MNSDASAVSNAARPVLRVISGNPTPEEIAAIVAIVSRRGAPTEPAVRPWSRWADKGRMMPQLPSPGPGAWRASTMP